MSSIMMNSTNNNSSREESLTFTNTNPSSSSSPVTFSDQLDATYLSDPRSASGSLQNESVLVDGMVGNNDSEFGFFRPDFRLSPLVGSVEFYERHIFLCYKNPRVWPPRIEAAEFDRLPRLLYAAVMARTHAMKKQTRLTICEGHDGAETSNGDVLIFPDMIRYRRLTHFDVETFVEEVLVKDGEWLPGNPEALKTSYVFVCCHGARDRRCGVCGPVLVSRFREEIELQGLQSKVFVSACSHIGGHKYAGNVIIFGSSINGKVTGHWYGYVAPDDVSVLLQQHIVRGEILDSLWRGQMGLSQDEQKKSQEQRLNLKESMEVLMQMKNHEISTDAYGSQENNFLGCCQGNGDSSCCQNQVTLEKTNDSDAIETQAKLSAENESSEILISQFNSRKGASRKHRPSVPTWLDSWENEDTYAALAVVCAAVSVYIAYSCYKQLR